MKQNDDVKLRKYNSQNQREEDLIIQRVYGELCWCCPRAKQCHEDCTTCDDFDDLVQSQLQNKEK